MTVISSSAPREPTAVNTAGLEFPYPLQFLNETSLLSVSAYWKNKTVIDLSSEATVDKCMETMIEHGITAIAIYEPLGHGEKEYVGMINARDLVAYTVADGVWETLQAVSDTGAESSVAVKNTELSATFSSVEKAELKIKERAAFFKRPIGTLLGETSESTKLHILNPQTPLLTVVNIFRCGVHHVLVVDGLEPTPRVNASRVRGIVSQGDLIYFLWENKDQEGLQSVFNQSARGVAQFAMQFSDFQDPSQPTKLPGSRWTGDRMKYSVHLSGSETVLNAFKTMSMHRVSSLAVTDDDGALIGSLSTSDLLLFSPSNIRVLGMALKDFLGVTDRGQHMSKVVWAEKSCTLGDIAGKLVSEDVHRVWLVEDSKTMKPFAPVSMSDVMAVLVPMSSSFQTGE